MRKAAGKAQEAVVEKRCAVYTRKSTAAGLEMEFNSLDAQREACEAFIRGKSGWVALQTRYDDGGFTGANIDRPAFQRLLADIDSGLVDVVVVYKVDRLSRSLLDFAKVMERLSGAGASFVSVTQNFSTADAMGRLTLNMLMSFAEFEREMIAERTRDKMAAARRKGKWTGGHVPFGYSLEDRRLKVNEGEAVVVREAFRLLTQHRQMALVARELNSRGLLPRRREWGVRKAGLRWTKDSVARVLRSPVYAGMVACGAERHPGEHPALVDNDTWTLAQDILEGRLGGGAPRGTNPDYVLRGLLRCGLCGQAMSPASTRKGTVEYRYYRCSTRDKDGPKVCRAAPLPAQAIEDYVAQRIVVVTSDAGFIRDAGERLHRLVEERRKQLLEQRTTLAHAVAAASAKASACASEVLRLEGKARELVEKQLTAEGEALAQAEQALRKVEEQLTTLGHQKAEADWVVKAMGDFGQVWGVLTSANRGRLLRALVHAVVVDEASGRVEVHLADFSGLGAASPKEKDEAAA